MVMEILHLCFEHWVIVSVWLFLIGIWKPGTIVRFYREGDKQKAKP